VLAALRPVSSWLAAAVVVVVAVNQDIENQSPAIREAAGKKRQWHGERGLWLFWEK